MEAKAGYGLGGGGCAASAVVGLVGREGEVIRKTAVVFLYYVVVAGTLGIFLA